MYSQHQQERLQQIQQYMAMYPMSCIIEPKEGKGGLWLGSIDAAQDVQGLQQEGIEAVLTVAARTGLNYDRSQIKYHEIFVVDDVESENLERYFDQIVDFIDRSLKKTNLLVHCFAGISRSSSSIIAYLMKIHQWTFEKSLYFLRNRRKITNPNQGFVKQLLNYEKKCIKGTEYRQLEKQKTNSPARPFSAFNSSYSNTYGSPYNNPYSAPYSAEKSNFRDLYNSSSNMKTEYNYDSQRYQPNNFDSHIRASSATRPMANLYNSRLSTPGKRDHSYNPTVSNTYSSQFSYQKPREYETPPKTSLNKYSFLNKGYQSPFTENIKKSSTLRDHKDYFNDYNIKQSASTIFNRNVENSYGSTNFGRNSLTSDQFRNSYVFNNKIEPQRIPLSASYSPAFESSISKSRYREDMYGSQRVPNYGVPSYQTGYRLNHNYK